MELKVLMIKLFDGTQSRDQLAENAIGMILAGSDDWSAVEANDLDIRGEHEWQDDTCLLRFTVNGTHLGFWDIDFAEISDEMILDDIAAEVEAAVSGMEFDAINEGIEPTIGSSDEDATSSDTYIFKGLSESDWEDAGIDGRRYVNKKCKIVNTISKGKDFNSSYYTIEFEDGAHLTCIRGKYLEKVEQIYRNVGEYASSVANEGIEPAFDPADQEGPSQFLDADTYIFNPISRDYWDGEWLDVKDLGGKRCKVTGTAVNGPDFESSYHDIEFEDGTPLSAICGCHLTPVLEESKKVKTEGATKKFHNIDTVLEVGNHWYKILDQNSEDTLIVELDRETGKPRNRYIIAWGLQRDGSWNQGHYFTDEASARKSFDERAKKAYTEAVEGFKAGRMMDRQPDSGTWLRYDYRDHTSYQAFGKDSEGVKQAEFCYNAVVNDFKNGGGEGFPDLQCISLGFTCTNGRPSYRWQQWIDQIEKPLTESVESGIEALKKFGYEMRSSDMGEVYVSDEFYCPVINIYEDGTVEVEPLSSSEDLNMPISMTVAEHGQMVLKLAQIQKVLETL